MDEKIDYKCSKAQREFLDRIEKMGYISSHFDTDLDCILINKDDGSLEFGLTKIVQKDFPGISLDDIRNGE